MTVTPRKRTIGLSALLLTMLTVLAGLFSPVKPAAAEESTILERSWPREGLALWVPIRESNLLFTEPVNAQQVTLMLSYNGGEPEEATRLTTGESVTTVVFRMPVTRLGDYEMTWQATTTDGEEHSGVVAFSLKQSDTFVGGQNHRHGENAHLIEETSQAFALRLLFMVPVAVFLGVFLFQRLRSSTVPLVPWVVRVGGAFLVLASLIGAVVDVADRVFEYHDYPLLAALSAPGFMLFPALLALAAYLLFTGRAGWFAALAGLAVAAVRAGMGHPVGGLDDVVTIATYFVVMVAAAASWSLATISLFSDWDSGRRSARWLAVTSAVCALASFAMLFLHSRTFDLRVDFAADFSFRVSAAVVVVFGALTALVRPKARPVRIALGVVALVAVVAASAALVWMPPPAAGL